MVEALGDGRYLVEIDGEERLVYAVAQRDRTWVFVQGRTFVIEARDAGQRAGTRPTDDQAALAAPMPAAVLAVKTAVGRTVSKGDVLVTLEAMKMELPITAPHDGRVKAINCRVGELVQPGVPLVELE